MNKTIKEKIVGMIMDKTEHGFFSACEEAEMILSEYRKNGTRTHLVYTDKSKTRVLEISLLGAR